MFKYLLIALIFLMSCSHGNAMMLNTPLFNLQFDKKQIEQTDFFNLGTYKEDVLNMSSIKVRLLVPDSNNILQSRIFLMKKIFLMNPHVKSVELNEGGTSLAVHGKEPYPVINFLLYNPVGDKDSTIIVK